MFNNEIFRFGSADSSDACAFQDAGMFEQTASSIFVGYFQGRPVFYNSPAGMVVTGGARSGKMTTFLAKNLLPGTCKQTLLVLDPKGEGAYLSQDQTQDQKFCAYWNPAALHGLPQDRINPFGHLRIDSPTLVSDTKVTCENFTPNSGSPQGAYFEGRAREVGEAFCLFLAEINGVVTPPDLYLLINLVALNNDAWLDFAFAMSESRFPLVRRIEEEIAASRENPGAGWQGILGELYKSFSCLSDPILMESVSPPYTMSLDQLCDSDQAWQVYLMPPAEFISAWSPIIKSIFVCAMAYKSRAPSAPRQVWFLDECGQLANGVSGGFPLVTLMFTYGAGIGITPVCLFQTNEQMNGLAKNASALISSSAGCRLMFAIRDMPSAQEASRMLGKQTLVYDDTLRQSQAAHERRSALLGLIAGRDPVSSILSMAQKRKETAHQAKQQRDLMTPDEVMRMPADKALLFADGLRHPAQIDRRPYWTEPGLNFHPNPYHPPLDRVQLMTKRGPVERRIIRAPVPKRFEHYPQYRDGFWSCVEE